MVNYKPKFRGEVDPYTLYPSKVQAGDIWQDTSIDVSFLKRRNAANSAWVLFRIDGDDHLSTPVIVAAATTGNIDVSAVPSTIDGLTMEGGDWFLAWNQTDPTENAVYEYVAAGLPAAAIGDIAEAGMLISVYGGDTYADVLFVLATDPPIEVGVTELTFQEFSGGDTAPSGPAGGSLAGTYPNPTLTAINSNIGSFGSASQTLQVTATAEGRVTAISAGSIQIAESQVTGLVSDLASKLSTISGISVGGSLSGTLPNPGLSTVNSNVGSFGSATQAVLVTATAEGRITAISAISIQIAESQVTNLVTDLAAKVTGPGSATDLTIPVYDGTTGKLIKGTTAKIDASGNLTVVGLIKGNDGSGAVIVADNAGNTIFRGVQANGWVDSVTTTYFQIGANGGNALLAAAAGTNIARFGIQASGTTIANVQFVTIVPAPTHLLELLNTGAGTSDIRNMLALMVRSNGAGANGLGAAINTKIESSTTDYRDASALVTRWTDATDATRTAAFTIAVALNGSVTERVRVNGNGNVSIGSGSAAGNLIIGANTVTPGTSGVGVLVIANGTRPTTSPVDVNQLYSQDIVAGAACLYGRSEAQGEQRILDLKKRLSTNQSFSGGSMTTFATLGELTHDVRAGEEYTFTIDVPATSDVAGGIKLQIAGTATFTTIWIEALVFDSGSIAKQSRVTAAATPFADVTAVTVPVVRATGSFKVNAAGTVLLQGAANAGTGTTVFLTNAYFNLESVK